MTFPVNVSPPVEAEAGIVIIDCPGAIIPMTIDAATELSDHILAAVSVARAQQKRDVAGR